MRDFLRSINSEFRTQFTLPKICIALLIAFIPLIGPIAQTIEVDDRAIKAYQLSESVKNITAAAAKEALLIKATSGFIGRIFSEAVIYTLGIRLFGVFRDKATLDKNRASYLMYNKKKVLFSKTFVESILFLVTVSISALAGLTIILNKGGVLANKADFAISAFLYIISITIFFVFVVFGLRLLFTSIKNNVKKTIAIATWIAITISTYVVLSVLTGVKLEIREFFVNNINWISFVPILNIATPSLILLNFVEPYFIIPLTMQMLIFIIVFYKKLSISLKEHLCT